MLWLGKGTSLCGGIVLKHVEYNTVHVWVA